MEKQFKCTLLLSLKEISLRRVAVLLFRDSDILASISKMSVYRDSTFEKGDKWQGALDDKMKNKMLKLDIPESLTNEMFELVGLMGLEVRAWKHGILNFAPNNVISLPGLAKLCWTTAGTINYRKTAEELLLCNKLDVVQRYTIACYYCLEDHISLYWEELPEGKKDTYIRNGYNLNNLTYFWPYILKGEHSELDNLAYNRNRTSFNQYAFENSAKKCNKTAAEYFFQKLTHEERDASLMRTSHVVMADSLFYADIALSNIVFYFLSLMTPEQQMEIIKAHPIVVFFCFLRSQLQGLFLENAGLLWASFPPSSYIALLKRILNCYPIIYFPKMIKEFFVESPQDLKTCFVDETSSTFPETPANHFLRVFFRSKDSECIKVIFRNVDAADRVKIVRRDFYLFFDSMFECNWHLVELCLQEATLSQEEKGRLKDDFTVCLENEGFERQVFKRLFEFLDENRCEF